MRSISKRQFAHITFILTIILSIVALLSISSVLVVNSKKIDDAEKFLSSIPTSTVYLADGKILTEFHADQSKTIVPLEDISGHFINTVIAIEDERFYKHNGVDIEGIVRALNKNILEKKAVEGGSTITQQLAKNLFVDKEKTIYRKIREMLLAVQMEERWGKNKILEYYLNIIYYGKDCYGIDTAARKFFGKKPADLTLEESALLAGVIKSPIKYSPHSAPGITKERRNTVLNKLYELGYISSEETEIAKSKPVKIIPWEQEKTPAPYFVEYLKQLLIEKFGANLIYKGGLKIYSTLDMEKQQIAERIARKTFNKKSDPSVALVAIEPPTGNVKAILGGTDYYDQQFNLAVQGKRQPGSAFKTFALVAALEKNIKPDTIFESTPIEIPIVEKNEVWKVTNFEGSGGVPVTLREATVHSINAAFARLVMTVGADRVADVAQRMGIKSYINPDPAIVLGGLKNGVSPLEMASAYATLANNGKYVAPTLYTKITDPDGNLIDEIKPESKEVIKPSLAYMATLILKDVISRGTGKAAAIARPAAGKTGTSQEYRDAWFIGYTPQLSTAVWVGHPDAQIEMTNVNGIKVTGGTFPASVWSQFMYYSLEGQPVVDFPKPESAAGGKSYVKVLIDPVTMQRATKWCPNPIEIELEKELIPKYCTLHKEGEFISIPSLIGLSTKEAEEKLTDAGLKSIIKSKEAPADAKPYTVFGQNPRSGSKVIKGTTVKLYIP